MLSISIYLLFYFLLLFPALFGIKIRKENKTELLTKEESGFIKGVSALMVFLSHSQAFLAKNGQNGIVLKPFSVLGGIGVLLFFFLSGYGIYKGYADKEPTFKYWKNRIFKVLIPALIISFLSASIILFIKAGKIGIAQLFKDAISSQWYVDVVMLEYLIFFISWIIAGKKKGILLTISIIGSIITGAVFWKIGLNERWYNGLLLFPAGMLFGLLETTIVRAQKKYKLITLFVSLVGFALTGFLFSTLKGNLIGDFIKPLSGVFLASFMILAVSFLKVGNPLIAWIGERSLYIYLCHLNLLSLFYALNNKYACIHKPEIWIYILLIGTVLYSELMFILLAKGLRGKKQ